MSALAANHEPHPTSLGERIAQARRGKGWTAQMLAQRVYVATRTIQRYEAGTRDPLEEILLRIARETGVDANWLIGGTPTAELEAFE